MFLFTITSYIYSKFIFKDELIGEYYLVNYENAFSMPNLSDSLFILNDFRFVSKRYGTGQYSIDNGVGITYIHLDTDEPSDILGHTFIRKSINGDLRIFMNEDENVYYRKIR